MIEESGEKDSKSSYSQAIDEWISIIDGVESKKQEALKEAGRLEGHAEEARIWRDSQFQTQSRKRGRPGKERRADSEAEDSS